MAYIFLDESGDLGFKPTSSNWFIFTIVLTNDHRRLEKCVKKTHRALSKKYKKVSELHAYHTQSAVKKKLLSDMAKLDDLKILCIVLNKKKVYIDLQNQNILDYFANCNTYSFVLKCL